MRLYFIAPLLAGLAFSAATGPPAEAHHNSESHCPQDPTGDHYVDIFDLSEFAGAYGTPAPHLDFWPAPLGDGTIDVIGEIANVAGMFGQNCIGATSGSSAAQAPFARSGLWGCSYNIWFPNYFIQDGRAYLSSWGGGVGCFGDGGNWKVSCLIQAQQLINGVWQLRATLLQVTDVPGTICVGNSGLAGHSFVCGPYPAAGFYVHEYWLGGQPYHPFEGHWMLSSWDEVFTPC